MEIATANKLLLNCLAGKSVNTEITAQFALQTASDWIDLVQQARQESISPLLYRYVTDSSSQSDVPDTVAEMLQTDYLNSALRNTGLYHELVIILKALKREGISVILLKGVHLAKYVYGNPALRPMADIDILVKKNDLFKAEKILLELEYISSEQDKDIREAYIQQHHHLPLLIKKAAVPVEIHWTISSSLRRPFTIDIEGLWERACPVLIADCEVWTLSPEDLLLHLCIHAVSANKYYKDGMRSFFDIRETIRHYRDELDWDRFVFCTRRWSADKVAFLTMYLAKSLLGAEVPHEYLEILRPKSFTPQLAEDATNRIIEKTRMHANVTYNVSYNKLTRTKSFLETITILLNRLFLPKKQMAALYQLSPHSLSIYFYYFVRLKDLHIRWSRSIWKLKRQKQAAARQADLIDWLTL